MDTFAVGAMDCLVLDYCGEPLSVVFADLEWKTKCVFFVILHNATFVHSRVRRFVTFNVRGEVM